VSFLEGGGKTDGSTSLSLAFRHVTRWLTFLSIERKSFSVKKGDTKGNRPTVMIPEYQAMRKEGADPKAKGSLHV
jgi:hypothetical protein